MIDSSNILETGTTIPAGSDLNDYTTIGRYNVTGSGAAVAIDNTPVTNAGYGLIVMNVGSMVAQIAIIANRNRADGIYIRIYQSTAATPWGNWYSINETAV